jgi:phosphate transport system substrate-binding protein
LTATKEEKMKKTRMVVIGLWILTMAVGLTPGWSAAADQVLRYSSSAQVHAILTDQSMQEFTKQTGIQVELFVCSSDAALHRLYNNVCDVASTGERIYFPQGEYGYFETPFCKAPLVVLTHPQTPITNISEDQLRDVFTGKIVNWKELGGPDMEILVIVPGKDTAAFKNFSQLALKRSDILYDIMTYRSTMVVETIRRMPGSISFITKGAETRDASVKILQVNGVDCTSPNYPYSQTFSLVTKGKPAGSVKAFVDYVTSEKVKSMLTASGIQPLN